MSAVRTSTAREPEERPVSRLLLDPTLVDRGGLRPAVRAVEEDHLSPIAVGFEEGLQILLGAARLGEDQRLACGAGRGHLFEADLQGLEQRLRLGVDADAARPGGEPLQDVDLLAQLLAVDRDRGVPRALRLRSFSARISSSRSSSISSASISASVNSGSLACLLVAQRFQAKPQRVERGSDGLRRRGEQLAQDQRGQMPLPLGKRVAVLALEKGGDRLVESVLVVGRLERPRDRPPLGVADVLRHLVAQRALAEDREALPEGLEIAPGARRTANGRS